MVGNILLGLFAAIVIFVLGIRVGYDCRSSVIENTIVACVFALCALASSILTLLFTGWQ